MIGLILVLVGSSRCGVLMIEVCKVVVWIKSDSVGFVCIVVRS